MRAIKIIGGVFAGLWLLTVLLIGAGGAWVTNNTDELAESFIEASGIDEQIAKADAERCRAAEEAFNQAWNRAVDTNTLEGRADELDRAQSAARAACA
ncbi:MAG: hypothetical protein H6919_05940 [Sphingomonadaceae bacterium]|nr:hypothetical protein [Sphingomonadaceae bacterium]MCB2085019.1 hypothetical protein [Sphingomonadaceae bacterium]MCP5383259.1 hypothetical protein [Altererythrobacter sp.]MCP5393436.1 hypothetical protein [Sphingomonadaceae bacterium]